MTNQQLKAHCEDVIANPQGHLDWVVDMAKALLPCLEAEPAGYFTYHEDEDGDPTDFIVESDSFAKKSFKLYRSPPLPELKLPEKVSCDGFNPKEWDEARSLGQCEGWNACIYDFKRLNGVTS